VLEVEAAAVYLADDRRLEAAGVAGAAAPTLAPEAAGAVGRAIDTGAPARVASTEDPAFPGLSPLSVLAAPLVTGRRVTGAIAVARAGSALPTDDDETALRLIALAAAPAVEGARAHDSTAVLALTDPLTGLGNRRRLDRDLAEACGGDPPAPVGLVMIDVDHFKAFNDAHGHPAGDALLREVAAVVSGAVRDGDLVYRFGGEEICVLLPGAGDHDAPQVAERVRAAVAAHDFPLAGSQPGGRLTISAGAARSPRPEATTLLQAADAALYRAKRAGRDRVESAPAP
jgi:diguanylate cyclase (GGDEF)-like protein